MSSVSPDFDSVFSDTSVLFDFILDQDNGDAEQLLVTHPSKNVVSNDVRREFTDVRDRRREIIKSVLRSHKQSSLGDWDPPQSLISRENDRRFLQELLSDVREIESDSDIVRYLSERERLIERAEEVLFETENRVVDRVTTADYSATLLGNLQVDVENVDDRKVICGAADWADQNSGNTMVSSDHSDIISSRDEIERKVSRDRNVSELRILTKSEFLDQDPAFTR